MQKQSSQPWLYFCCGCVGCFAFLVAGGLGAGFLGFTALKDYTDTLRDPESRNARAREILGAEELPEGYTAQLYFRIPKLLEIVVLTDGEPAVWQEGDNFDEDDLTEEQLGENFFLYLSAWDRDDDMDPFSPDTDDRVKVDSGFHVRSEEILGEGDLTAAGGRVSYTNHRGELINQEKNQSRAGVFSQLEIHCESDDPRSRFALWFRHGENITDLAGTPADRQALASFLQSFDVCP
jgi:hypothetical protein